MLLEMFECDSSFSNKNFFRHSSIFGRNGSRVLSRRLSYLDHELTVSDLARCTVRGCMPSGISLGSGYISEKPFFRFYILICCYSC
jgi:hypothetical protein